MLVYRLLNVARRYLRLPIGFVFCNEPEVSVRKAVSVCDVLDLRLAVTVGDVVTRNVMRFWRVPDVAVVDGRTRRSESVSIPEEFFDHVIHVVNERSTISDDVLAKLEKAISMALGGAKVLVKVLGEEDVLAIPLILLAPRAAVMYGNVFLNALVLVPSMCEYKLAALKLLAEFRCEK